MANRGTLFVVSAPSGAGKDSILEKALDGDDRLRYSVSVTTREPRRDEVDGVDYLFLDTTEFLRRVDAGEFVEWAKVHGNYYGTLRSELVRMVGTGEDIVAQLDVQGMHNLKVAGVDMVSIFIAAPSFEELERRLKERGANSDEEIALRLLNGRQEMKAKDTYDHVIVNDVLEEAVEEFETIIRAARKARSKA